MPADDIEPGLYFKNAYYIEPEELGKKPYHLLRKALEATGRMAIAKIALRDREHLCALHANGNGLLMNTLNWPDEIRSTEGLKGLEGEVKINPKELEMAKALIESLADTFDPQRYKDEYREAVMRSSRPRSTARSSRRPRRRRPPRSWTSWRPCARRSRRPRRAGRHAARKRSRRKRRGLAVRLPRGLARPV